MIIEYDKTLIVSSDFNIYEFDGDTFYIHGLLYIPGIQCGYESVRMLSESLSSNQRVPFSMLRGAFTCVIKRGNGDVIAFSDNSNLHCLYLGEHAVSSHYLPLLQYYKEHGLQLTFNEESVCEYYTLGGMYFGKTHVRQISILDNDKFIVVNNDGFNIRDKECCDIASPSAITQPQQFYDLMAGSFSDMKVCSALTGGYDSRMVYACLEKTLSPQPFYSTNNENSLELMVSSKVASVAGKDTIAIHTGKPTLTTELLTELIHYYDGICPLSLESNMRIRHFRNVMEDDGFNLQLTGDGGVLHKDWEWMQDLPFYHRKHTNLKRFYHQRIAYGFRNNCLSSRYTDISDIQESRFVERLQQYVRETNTQSYDNLYMNVSGNRRMHYNHGTQSYIMYAPLEELDIIRYSYHLPRRKRFFYNSMREITTAANRDIARIPTSYGTTASSETRYMFRDIFYQLINCGKKGCRMISRKLFKISVFVGNEIDWSLENELREHRISHQAIQYAKDINLLQPDAKIGSLTYSQLQRLVHLYLLGSEFGITAAVE